MKDAGFLQNRERGMPMVRGRVPAFPEAASKGCCGDGGLADLIAGFLLGDPARCAVAGAAARKGIVSLSCMLAGHAWADWQDGGGAPPARSGGSAGLEEDGGGSADGLCERLLQAMVAGAKAGGRVSREERRFIHRRLRELDLECEAQALIAAELEAPLDARRIARLARSTEEAASIYAASLLAAGRGGGEGNVYLADLAGMLQLDAVLITHLQRRVASAGSFALRE
ncbi:DUF533 domain-containing protein [Cereibacter azotoformans]|uniref:DUF533 domain-containing protein n=1 Tax=Cereibacter azotoformans TaxID=43057 RepID=UPI000C6C9F30|nr:DUF533 domain-containing protein [Cereibacter azotoformans]